MAMLVRKGLAATTIAAAAVLSLCFPATPGFGESALESDFKLGSLFRSRARDKAGL
jgi:hypothetical protein